MSKFNVKKFLAEMLGTFVLVFVACGVAMVSGVNLVATALAFGLVIVAMAYTIGPVSGCHINPAVSFGAAINKRITWFEFFYYVVAQFVGAVLGALLLYGVLKTWGQQFPGLGQNGFRADTANAGNVNLIGALIVEIVLTFIFVLTILTVTGKKSGQGAGKKAGLIIGLTLTLVHLIGIGLTGTSVNPARSFGPALVMLFEGESLPITQVWVFIVAPLVGAALAALVGKFLIGTEEEPQAEAN
ncbi:aquaporin [Clostridia bacterium]|nr:aquaporin [Clostridia bacterium]